jgi:hypothetical protein
MHLGHRSTSRAAAAAATAAAVIAGCAFASAQSAAAAAPATVTAGQLQNLENVVRAQTGRYAGLWIDSKTDTVYVSTTDAAVTPSFVAAQVPARASGAPAMKIQVVRAKYDADQLDRIAARIPTDSGLRQAAARSGATVSTWYPDPVTDRVVIGFTKVTASETARVRAEYGATARVITAPIAQAAILRVPTAKLPSIMKAHALRAQDSRTDDSAPWFGGDLISYTFDGGSWICTSGFDFGGSMSTAGHCGSDPTAFYNGGVYVGTTHTMQWGNGRIDMQLMNGSTYLPSIWAGTVAAPVSGSGGVAIGGTYCTDGAMTGQNCTAVVEAVDVCSEENDDGTTVDVCDLDKAYSSNNTSLIQGGDSGGPVYTAASTGAPFAVGTISAQSNGGLTGFFSDMYEEKVIFGQSPAT